MNSFNPAIKFVFCLLLLAITAVIALGVTKHIYPFQAELMDSLHFPAAILLIYCTTYMLRRYNSRSLPIFIAFAVIIALEIIQPFFGRSAQLRDIIHGVLGITVFVLWPFGKPPFRIMMLLTGFVISSQNLLGTLLLKTQTVLQMPSIMVKPNAFTAYGWQKINDSRIMPILNSKGELRLSALLLSARWQGVMWQNPWGDLSTSKELCFSGRASSAVNLQIRIDDVHSHNYQSRFNHTVTLTNYWQEFCFDISNIKDLQHRALDKKRILSVYFFSKATADMEPTPWFALANVKIMQ